MARLSRMRHAIRVIEVSSQKGSEYAERPASLRDDVVPGASIVQRFVRNRPFAIRCVSAVINGLALAARGASSMNPVEALRRSKRRRLAGAPVPLPVTVTEFPPAIAFPCCPVYGERMARLISTTVRLDEEDVRALRRARAAGHSSSDLIRKGLRVVASRYYTKRRPPSTRLFESVDTKLGDESKLFRDLDR